METIFIIKNFKRTKDCILTIKSIRHFCDNEISVLHLFNESIDETSLNDYNSKINPLNKEELRIFLFNLNLL